MRVKICGITNQEDAHNAVSLGADALGFIFAKDTPRYVDPETVQEIAMSMPPFVSLVGLFVNQDVEEVKSIMVQCRLDVVQLHGDESPGYCMALNRRVIKAFPVSDIEDLVPIAKYKGIISAALLDTKDKEKRGGTGRTFDWGVALKAQEFEIPVILAGGITISNIKKAIQLVNPYAVDISSGVESEVRKKDYNKMKEVIGSAKES